MANEVSQAKAYIVATATGASLTAYDGVADLKAPAPWVVFNALPALDKRSEAGVRLLTKPLIQIEAVAPIDQYTDALAAADTLDGLFGLVRNASQGGVTIEAIYREQAIDRVETTEGTRYAHVGGLYRFLLG